MATGNVHMFSQAAADINNKLLDWDSDDVRMGIVTTTTVPTVGTVAPHWGGTGTTNFAANQVALATGYTGPVVLTGKSLANVSNVITLRADPITIPQDAAGFTNGAYGILYDNTDANKRCFGFVELSAGGALSLVAGQVVVDWSGATNDIFTFTVA